MVGPGRRRPFSPSTASIPAGLSTPPGHPEPKGISNVDESGLDTVAFCATRFHDIGGGWCFLTLPITAQVADTSKLNLVSETYQEESEAVNSFFPDRVVPRYDILEFVNEQKQPTGRKASAAEFWVQYGAAALLVTGKSLYQKDGLIRRSVARHVK